MEIGDRVMVGQGKRGGMIGTLVKVRMGKVLNSKAKVIKPVGTVRHDSTERTFDELIDNLKPVPVHPFA